METFSQTRRTRGKPAADGDLTSVQKHRKKEKDFITSAPGAIAELRRRNDIIEQYNRQLQVFVWDKYWVLIVYRFRSGIWLEFPISVDQSATSPDHSTINLVPRNGMAIELWENAIHGFSSLYLRFVETKISKCYIEKPVYHILCQTKPLNVVRVA